MNHDWAQNFNEKLELELGYKMTNFGLGSIMYKILIYNITLSHKGAQSIKIVQLPKITQNLKRIFCFLLVFQTFEA